MQRPVRMPGALQKRNSSNGRQRNGKAESAQAKEGKPMNGTVGRTRVPETTKPKQRLPQKSELNSPAAAQAAAASVVAVNAGGVEFPQVAQELVKPANQLHLSETELSEQVPRQLSTADPHAPQDVVRFNNKERMYRPDTQHDHLMVHGSCEGSWWHKDSEEGQKQADADRVQHESTAAEGTQAEASQTGAEVHGAEVHAKLHNQFNFNERAVQTTTFPPCDRATATEPPPTATVSGSCSHWEMHDAYTKDQQRQRQEEEANRRQASSLLQKATSSAPPAGEPSKDEGQTEQWLHSPGLLTALKHMERMITQTSLHDIALDFKYWDDPADAVRQQEGTLLPLWRFFHRKAKHKHVTCMTWNPGHWDLFAVGYGSYDFLRQGSGLICCYSLKNPGHSEYTFSTESGVMCIDVHPMRPNLLAVGCYDGSVLVLDLQRQDRQPVYQSTAEADRHTEPVWQVRWQGGEVQRELRFITISTDGRLMSWTLAKSSLEPEGLMELQLAHQLSGDDEGGADALVGASAGSCCFDFNPVQDHVFVVGTEEGALHKCSMAYTSEPLQTYSGHALAVYSAQWNRLHPDVFASASADWTVKLWHSNTAQPVMSFDLRSPVGDVAWAPYSSTVFAAVTNDGKVHVYDINQNTLKPVCNQRLVRKSKLTKLAFSQQFPVLLVGDDRGCVTALKLSPNLRRDAKPGDRPPTAQSEQIAKLDSVFALALKGEVGQD